MQLLNSVTSQALEIIDTYTSGNFARSVRGLGNVKYSKEAVFYVNSVNNIISIIRRAKLKPEECNILVARTDKNINKIHRKLGRKFDIGRVPLKGEPRKMFTFCTRTVYLGADFYSDNARTFVLSDANLQTLAVDISLDLPQILGRQRLQENPWRNEAEFYYKTITKKNKKRLEAIDFENEVRYKLKTTDNLLNVYKDTVKIDYKRSLVGKYSRDSTNYKFDYVAVDQDIDNNNEKYPVLNRLVIIAEKRAYDIQLTDYYNRFSLLSAVDYQFSNSGDGSWLSKFQEDLKQCKGDTRSRLRFICDYGLTDEQYNIAIKSVDEKTRSYLSLGKDLLKANGYLLADLDSIINNNLVDISPDIYSEFKVGDKLTKSEIKEKLQDIYDKAGLKRKVAKASDLSEWFELKSGKSKDSSGKWVAGFELIRKIR